MRVAHIFGLKKAFSIVSIGIGLGMISGCTYDSVQPDVCFETEVLPVFVTYCSSPGCHNPTDREEGYDLTNYDGIMRGIKPKSVVSSKLLQTMGGLSDEPMPPKNYPQPSSGQIAVIKAWVRSGAANTTNCSNASCDTSATVSYSGNIQPMLQTYCIGCHSGANASASIDFSSFATAKATAIDGSLRGTITGDPNFTFMPPNSAPLPDCYAVLIQKWIDAGTPEN